MSDKLTYSVVDNKLTINAIHTNSIEGNIFLDGDLTLSKKLSVQNDSIFEQSVTINTDLFVNRELRVPILYADTLITKTFIEHKEPVSWASDRGGIEGKGLVWKRDDKNIDIFIYKSDPSRIFTNLDIDLYRGNSYSIDGTPVLSADRLGPSIINSSLRKVGRLKDLVVDGDVILGEHIFFDATSGRVGIGTDKASSAFTLVDNGVEFAMGSLYPNEGNFGTFSSHDLGLVTDNVTRMKISRIGKIIFGDDQANNADVSVHGKLYVKELIVDQRNDRTGPLEFRALKGDTNYGKGMMFTGQGTNKLFVFASEPDQFLSTENINLQSNKAYFINNNIVLTETELGRSVTKSSLTEVGILSYLKVLGEANINNVFQVKDNKVILGDSDIHTNNGLIFTGPRFEFKSDNQSVTINGDNITFGDKARPMVNAVINGKLAIGVQSIGNDAQLEVAGNIRFADKLFLVGSKAPTTGTYRKGDIIWNTEPKETGYVGWICVRDGNPGIWRGFGQIGIE